MKSYETQAEVLEALRKASKGSERNEILKNRINRCLILTTGASLIIYSGNITEGNSLKEKLSGVHVAVMQRRNSISGKPDGLGTFGGLAERTNPFEFYNMTQEQRKNLIGKKDDILFVNEVPVLTKDLSIIRRNNLLREAKEELSDLGIMDINFADENIQQIPIPQLKDDNYIINIWDGNGQSYAVNPYCHILQKDETFIDLLERQSRAFKHKKNSEADSIKKYPLFDVLSCFGNFGGKYTAEDGRNMQKDYRYPHEWLMTWVIASKILDNNPANLIKLAEEVQISSPHLVDFGLAIKKMDTKPSVLANTLGIEQNVFNQMQNNMVEIYQNKSDLFRQGNKIR